MKAMHKALLVLLALGSAGAANAADSWQCKDDHSAAKIKFTLTFDSANSVSVALESGEKLSGTYGKHQILDNTRLHGMLDYSITLFNAAAGEGDVMDLNLNLTSDNYHFWGNGTAYVYGDDDGETVLVSCKPLIDND